MKGTYSLSKKLGFFDNSSWHTLDLDQLLLKVLQFNLSLQKFPLISKMYKTTTTDLKFLYCSLLWIQMHELTQEMKLKYYCTCRSDLQLMLQTLASSLMVGHSWLAIRETVTGTCMAVWIPSCMANSRLKIEITQSLQISEDWVLQETQPTLNVLNIRVVDKYV